MPEKIKGREYDVTVTQVTYVAYTFRVTATSEEEASANAIKAAQKFKAWSSIMASRSRFIVTWIGKIIPSRKIKV